MYKFSQIQQCKPNVLEIKLANQDVIFRISDDGSLFYKVDDELKQVECDRELPLLFVSVISKLSGFNFLNKEDLYRTISHNFRNGQIDQIFNKKVK